MIEVVRENLILREGGQSQGSPQSLGGGWSHLLTSRTQEECRFRRGCRAAFEPAGSVGHPYRGGREGEFHQWRLA